MSPTPRFAAGALGIALALSAACGKPDASPAEQAGRANKMGEKNFAELINHNAQAAVSPTPWAGYWWPYTTNGIAQPRSGRGSPAGKYDAARGGTTQAQEWEIGNHGAKVKGVQGWWGHCNGWTAASILYPEPHADVTVNGITFDIADQKALITEAGMEASADFFGDRVEPWNGSHWDDTIPDQYFLVLTNYIGRNRQGVAIDRYTGDQVWNQPVVAYSFDYPKRSDYVGEDARAPGVYRINVTSDMYWAEDGVSASAQTPQFDFNTWESATDGHGTRVFSRRTLKMEIWLDGPVEWDGDRIVKSGNVIVARQGDLFVGGQWMMGGRIVNGWPDYMWVPYSVLTPTDYGNRHIDVRWLQDHIMVAGGRDDTSVRPIPVPIAPDPEPTDQPSDRPTPRPSNPPNLPPVPRP